MSLASYSELLRHLGPSKVAHTLAYRALQRSCDYKAMIGCVAEPGHIKGGRDAALPRGYSARFLDYDELRAFARVPANDLDDAFLDEARARGDRCFAVMHGDTPASLSWYAHAPVPINEHVTLHFDSRYRYIYKALTLPAHRGKRLNSISITKATYTLLDEGAHGVISYIETRNHPSLRSAHYFGHKQFGIIRCAKVGGTYHSWASPGCRPYGFRVDIAR